MLEIRLQKKELESCCKKKLKNENYKELTCKCESVGIAHIWSIPKISFSDGWWAFELETMEAMAKCKAKVMA